MAKQITQTSILKAIRKKCVDCSAGNLKEVKLCPCVNCPLYPFRFGKSDTNSLSKTKKSEKDPYNIPTQQKENFSQKNPLVNSMGDAKNKVLKVGMCP